MWLSDDFDRLSEPRRIMRTVTQNSHLFDYRKTRFWTDVEVYEYTIIRSAQSERVKNKNIFEVINL